MEDHWRFVLTCWRPEARIRAKEKRKKVKKAEKLRAKRQAEQAGCLDAKPNHPFPQRSTQKTSKCIQIYTNIWQWDIGIRAFFCHWLRGSTGNTRKYQKQPETLLNHAILPDSRQRRKQRRLRSVHPSASPLRKLHQVKSVKWHCMSLPGISQW